MISLGFSTGFVAFLFLCFSNICRQLKELKVVFIIIIIIDFEALSTIWNYTEGNKGVRSRKRIIFNIFNIYRDLNIQ